MTDTQTQVEAPETTQRVVTAIFATYQSVEHDLLGRPSIVVRTADRGELVTLPVSEAERLETLHAVAPEGVAVEDAEGDRVAALDAYRAERGDREAAQAIISRALAPTSQHADAPAPQPSVAPPGGGAAPIGEFVTGDTGREDVQRERFVDTGLGGRGGGIVRADAPDVATSDVATLAAWIADEGPNANDTVALAEDDPELARKVLEAEVVATGDDARKTVASRLGSIIERGSGTEDG